MQKKNTIVNTRSGKLQGVFDNNLFVFKGIPYAAPPTGDFRWMPPQPVKSWSGTRSAEKFGPICPQNIMQPMGIPRPSYTEEPQAEDCLFLNVWTPGLDDKRRAVMVWIHGGAFTNGSGSSPMHPGATLPKRGDVVLVTINYRLGPLGFLNLQHITGGKIPASGNEGLLDQVAALRWVYENIVDFGGDPHNVTVFGESAGAMSIGCLLAMPQAKGLFQKAILQSGANTCRPLDEAKEVTGKYTGTLGLTGKDTEKLKSLPVQTLLSTLQKMMSLGVRGIAMEPVVDGKVLPDFPLNAVKSGSAKGVTVMAGGNLNEGTLFALPVPGIAKLDEDGLRKRVEFMVPAKRAKDMIEAYRTALSKRSFTPTPTDIYVAIQGDKQFRMPNIRLVEIQCDLGFPSYSYVFDWKCAVPELGACHALDVGFVFGATYEEFHGSGPAVNKLAQGMQEAWTAFARTGNPNSPTLGEWQPYGKERNTMILGSNSHIEAAPYEGERAAWDQIDNEYLG